MLFTQSMINSFIALGAGVLGCILLVVLYVACQRYRYWSGSYEGGCTGHIVRMRYFDYVKYRKVFPKNFAEGHNARHNPRYKDRNTQLFYIPDENLKLTGCDPIDGIFQIKFSLFGWFAWKIEYAIRCARKKTAAQERRKESADKAMMLMIESMQDNIEKKAMQAQRELTEGAEGVKNAQERIQESLNSNGSTAPELVLPTVVATQTI